MVGGGPRHYRSDHRAVSHRQFDRRSEPRERKLARECDARATAKAGTARRFGLAYRHLRASRAIVEPAGIQREAVAGDRVRPANERRWFVAEALAVAGYPNGEQSSAGAIEDVCLWAIALVRCPAS